MNNEPLRELTTDEIKTYWQDGVVCARDIIPMDWIDRLRESLDRVLARPGKFSIDSNPPGSKGRFTFETWMCAYDSDFKSWIIDGPIPPLTAALLHSDKVHHLFDETFVKEPHSPYETVWHQDQPGNPVHGFNLAGTRLPLDVVTKDSGAVECIRASHKWTRWFAPDEDSYSTDGYEVGNTFSIVEPTKYSDAGDEARFREYGEKFEGMLDFASMRERGELDIVRFDTKPGDLVFQHLNVMHWAPGNYSNRRRRAVVNRWVGDGTAYANRAGRSSLTLPWNPELKDGDPFPPDNELFPQVWPRVA